MMANEPLPNTTLELFGVRNKIDRESGNMEVRPLKKVSGHSVYQDQEIPICSANTSLDRQISDLALNRKVIINTKSGDNQLT